MAEMSLTGSCLCGDVEYRIGGTQIAFWHCHCRRCRKASGTGHASNLIVTPVDLAFTPGEEHIARYKLLADSLDSDPGVEAGGRLFKGSAVSWSCSDGNTPEYEEYAPRA